MEKNEILRKIKKGKWSKKQKQLRPITPSLTTALQRMSLQLNRAEHKQQKDPAAGKD